MVSTLYSSTGLPCSHPLLTPPHLQEFYHRKNHTSFCVLELYIPHPSSLCNMLCNRLCNILLPLYPSRFWAYIPTDLAPCVTEYFSYPCFIACFYPSVMVPHFLDGICTEKGWHKKLNKIEKQYEYEYIVFDFPRPSILLCTRYTYRRTRVLF